MRTSFPQSGSDPLSPELLVMFAPARSYPRFVAGAPPSSWVSALRRPVLFALVLGASLAMASTNRVDVTTIASVTSYWSISPIVQWVAAWLLIASAPQRRVSLPHAIDLSFMANGPWLLWLLGFAGWFGFTPTVARQSFFVTLSAVIPALWTPLLMASFCRTALNDSPRRAWIRTLVHQGAIWAVMGLWISEGVQLTPRIVGWLHR